MGGQANTGSLFGFTNVKGTLQGVVSPNSTAGFSIVTYTGTGSAATVGHGLGVAPSAIIGRSRTNSGLQLGCMARILTISIWKQCLDKNKHYFCLYNSIRCI